MADWSTHRYGVFGKGHTVVDSARARRPFTMGVPLSPEISPGYDGPIHETSSLTQFTILGHAYHLCKLQLPSWTSRLSTR